MPDHARRSELTALLALLAGALAIGSSGIFVRLSETGPTATAFWRGCLALPPLALWALLERRAARAAGRAPPACAIRSSSGRGCSSPGIWRCGTPRCCSPRSPLRRSRQTARRSWSHCSRGRWWGEKPRLGFLLALVAAFAGMLLILAPKLGGGRHALLGDALGLGTACFYAAYILAVSRLRVRHGTGIVMFATTLVFSVLLLPLALTQKFLPDSAHGWWLLVGCALSAQLLGQSLIAYALAQLPATFGAVGLYVQVLAAAAYAWWLLHERLAPLQIAGGVVVLAAIALARRTRTASPGALAAGAA